MMGSAYWRKPNALPIALILIVINAVCCGAVRLSQTQAPMRQRSPIWRPACS